MTNQHPYMAIALAADLNYSEQVQTLIKSICYRHQNVRFYLFNKQFPLEWFHSLNAQLNQINCEILDAKVTYNWLEAYQTLPHISETTFYRYMLPQLPDSRVLYLDSDMIVDTTVLPDLYLLPLQGNLLAAAPDMLLTQIDHSYPDFPNMKPYFNAGLMLVDNDKWRELGVQQDLFNLTTHYGGQLRYADQDVLNIHFQGKWLKLNPAYNYQVGAIRGLRNRKMVGWMEKAIELGEQAQILHYTTSRKPWLMTPIGEEDVPKRDRYWHYQRMQWSEIIEHHRQQNG